jgi:hypothetical protein
MPASEGGHQVPLYTIEIRAGEDEPFNPASAWARMDEDVPISFGTRQIGMAHIVGLQINSDERSVTVTFETDAFGAGRADQAGPR